MIKVFSTAEALCAEAMELFISLAQKNILAKGSFEVALSGGRTPNLLYDMLAKEENASRVDWKNVFVFWGDERYVDFDNKDNNSFQARQHLLDHVGIPEENIYRIPVNGDHVADAAAYQHIIREHFKTALPVFDLLFLGMGEEGHTASIFPGSALLHETETLVKDIYVEVKQMQRISFTPALINAAKEIVFMVTGDEKAPALKEVLEGAYDPDLYPAQIVKPVNGHLTWLLDTGAAELLEKK
ncbi:MAG: 6-phosphogluconolactonase [Ferruginibacter sp.]